MKRTWLLVILFVLLPGVCHGGQYTLVLSKNDCLCQHMLKLYNDDIKKYGKIKYKNHKEFNWIKWEPKIISVVDLAGIKNDIKAKIAFFDINNDSKDEAIVYERSALYNSPIDVYDIFNCGDMAILNETVDGPVYYKKRLKGLSSATGVPVKVSDLSEEDNKKLPEKVQPYLEAEKQRGDKYTYFGNADQRINFLRIKNRFFITFEERSNAEMLAMALDRFYREGGDPKTSRRSNEWLVQGFNDLEKYTTVLHFLHE